jgi:hypothetical protein
MIEYFPALLLASIRNYVGLQIMLITKMAFCPRLSSLDHS